MSNALWSTSRVVNAQCLQRQPATGATPREGRRGMREHFVADVIDGVRAARVDIGLQEQRCNVHIPRVGRDVAQDRVELPIGTHAGVDHPGELRADRHDA